MNQKLERVIVGSFFKDDVPVVNIETKSGSFRIIADGDGLKVSVMSLSGNDQIRICPKATNMVTISTDNK